MQGQKYWGETILSPQYLEDWEVLGRMPPLPHMESAPMLWGALFHQTQKPLSKQELNSSWDGWPWPQ